MHQYGIFVKNGDGGISYLTNSILRLREFMPPFGIFLMNGNGVYKLSDQFYSALRVIMPHYGIFVMIGVGAINYLTTSILLFSKLFLIIV